VKWDSIGDMSENDNLKSERMSVHDLHGVSRGRSGDDDDGFSLVGIAVPRL
jgi:hypothetical protein